jgi:hypothetical protein
VYTNNKLHTHRIARVNKFTHAELDRFAKRSGFSEEKTSAVFTILKKTHEYSVGEMRGGMAWHGWRCQLQAVSNLSTAINVAVCAAKTI